MQPGPLPPRSNCLWRSIKFLSDDRSTKNHKQQESGSVHPVSRGIVLQVLQRRRNGVSSEGQTV